MTTSSPTTSSWIGRGSRTDAEVARALADAGYLKIRTVDHDGQTWWETTIEGNALAQASFGQPITRATAQRVLNADEWHLIDIAELVVFGGYLDLGVVLRDRVADATSTDATCSDALSEIRVSYADASGRRFSSYSARLLWPEPEALLILGNRSAAINITLEIGSYAAALISQEFRPIRFSRVRPVQG